MAKRVLKGIVVSNKMAKTVVVLVESIKKHPLYKKRYKVHKKFMAHNPEGVLELGKVVTIEESPPISKMKHWIVKQGESQL